MADLTAPLELKTLDNQTHKNALNCGVAATAYEGSMLVFLGAGRVTETPAAGLKFAGFAAETKVMTTSNTIQAWTAGPIFIPNTAAAATDEGEMVYVDSGDADNNPATGTVCASPTTSDDTAIGRCFRAEVGVGWWVNMSDKAVTAVAP